MRRVALLLLFSVSTLDSQTAHTVSHRLGIAAAAPLPSVKIPQTTLRALEKNFDDRLLTLDPSDPVDMLGGTRALYIPDYGTIFTTELNLAVAPGFTPFGNNLYTPEFKARLHQRKAAHVPKLEEAMKEMVRLSASKLPMSDDQKIIYAIRLRYFPLEDSSGLPAQIVMRADKKSALNGDIKTEVE
jgi:hypothetical protein